MGGYYTDEDSAIKQKILAVEAGTDTSPPAFRCWPTSPWTRRTRSSPGSRTPPGTPRRASISRSAGALSHNKQVASQLSDGPLVGGLTRFDDVESSESPFTFSVAPRFELGKSASVYGRVATGFRPGGPNVLPPAAPRGRAEDTTTRTGLTSYELGLKAGAGPPTSSRWT